MQYDLPVVIHTRSAWERMTDVIRAYRGRGLRGVFHAFSDTVETYRELRETGDFRFGVGGVRHVQKEQKWPTSYAKCRSAISYWKPTALS